MKEIEPIPLEIVKKHLDINFGFEYKIDEMDSSLQAVLIANPTAFHRILVINESVSDKKQLLYINIHAACHILLEHHFRPPFMGITEPMPSDDMKFRSYDEEEWHRQARILTFGIFNKRIERYWSELWSSMDLKGVNVEMEDDIKADSESLVKLLGDYNYHHDL